MSDGAFILALGAVDNRGVYGTSGPSATWEELNSEAPGDRRTFRTLYEKRDPTFRRLDGQTRAIVLAAEACGIGTVLSASERDEAALITETTRGSIEIDMRYTRSLENDVVEAAIFPYTLQSTCLGDVALRHGLRGPTVCLSSEMGEEGESLRETLRMFSSGVLEHAVVALVDVQTDPLPTADLTARAVVCVVSKRGPGITSWPDQDGAPFETLASACYRLATEAHE